ncbi:MAG: type IV pili methyl-accepting chemotaxis transducer N-terminal domain-containing protein [Campylobacterota bacterium]|nr:type IV pili methyl-accepting chemotaxis transducer N-terminal domain-containing protein [Campylobacterota bacterium]
MNKITTKVKLIGGILSLMIAAIVVITVIINQNSSHDSIVINVAGKQRMLTQKITKEVMWLQNRGSVDFTNLDAAISEFDNSLNDLMEGNDARGIYAPPKACIKARLGQVRALWLPFHDHLDSFKLLLSQTKTLKATMSESTEAILNISDRVVKQMVKEGMGGRYIDDAGRQRMLTQKLAFHSAQYLITGSAQSVTAFFNAYALYESTLKHFLSDARVQKQVELFKILEKNEQIWFDYANYIIDLMDKQKELNETLAYLTEINIVLLNTMDETVESYSTYSEDQRQFLQYFQYIASFFAVIFMIFAARLTKNIEQNFEHFLQHSEAMASSFSDEGTSDIAKNRENDELALASMHMSQFMQQMNTVIEHAQQAIHESEQAAQELAAISDSMDDELALDEDSKERIDNSEDIVIQTLDELSNTSQLLTKLQQNLSSVMTKTQNHD